MDFSREADMRKKSHISLARYIVDALPDEDLKKHKLMFYLGSILPDIKPSFLYKRHEMEATFPALRKHIARLSEGEKVMQKKSRKYYLDLGQVSHYLADYFTFPHNTVFPGNIKDHCSYEEKLKKDLREYIGSGRAAAQQVDKVKFCNAEALCDFIQEAHDEYIGHKHNVEDDIQNIVEINKKALAGMLEVLELNRNLHCLRHS